MGVSAASPSARTVTAGSSAVGWAKAGSSGKAVARAVARREQRKMGWEDMAVQ